MNEQKIIYYKDELNDEFSDAKIEPRQIDENYGAGSGKTYEGGWNPAR